MFWRKKRKDKQPEPAPTRHGIPERPTTRAPAEHETVRASRASTYRPDTGVKRTWPYRGVPQIQGDCQHALDVLISVMRTLADHRIDASENTNGVGATYSSWVEELEALRTERTRNAAFDWRELADFVELRRLDEADWVRAKLAQFRGTVQSFGRSLSETLERERVADADLSDGVERLLGAIAMDDPEAVREEALRTTELIELAISERQARQAARVMSLAQCVDTFCSAANEAEVRLDEETSLYTRPALVEHLSRLCDLSLLLKSMPCIMIVDLDGFGHISSQRGETVADDVLRATADTLTRHFLRKEDFVARYYGGTFAIVVPDISIADAEEAGARVCEAISEQATGLRGASLKVSASVGVSCLVTGEPVHEWVARAEHALSTAKRCGGARVAVASAPETPRSRTEPDVAVAPHPVELGTRRPLPQRGPRVPAGVVAKGPTVREASRTTAIIRVGDSVAPS